jgi:hypothetical protein
MTVIATPWGGHGVHDGRAVMFNPVNVPIICTGVARQSVGRAGAARRDVSIDPDLT